MSASSSPTLYPSLPSETARFTATVVLPTPPLPLPTATTYSTPGKGCGPCGAPAPACPISISCRPVVLIPKPCLTDASPHPMPSASLSCVSSLPRASRAAVLHLHSDASDVPSPAPAWELRFPSHPCPPPHRSDKPKRHGAAAAREYPPPWPLLLL